jgi:hypothetical protein
MANGDYTNSWDTSGNYSGSVWGDQWDTSGGAAAIDPSLLDASGNPIVPPIPPAGGPPSADRTWGQQLGDWLGISDANQAKIAAASKELKGSLGDLQNIQKLADPLAPKPGQVSTTTAPNPSQVRPAQSLDEVLQQLYLRRQQLAQLGLSGKPWQPRGPGGGLLGAS